MKNKKAEKSYIYIRDKGRCYFCNRDIKFKQISLDHYLPRSKSGPDDTFNLVLSCKKCNKLKKSYVPENYKDLLVKLFIKSVEDKKILGAALKIKQEQLINMVEEVYKLEDIGEYTIFQSKIYRFYVKQNKIYKVVQVETKYKN